MSISGDTRFDRVLEIAETKFNHPVFESFCSLGDVLIAGSTWPEDEEMLADLHSKEPSLKMVIAPHEISDSHLDNLKKLFPDSILFSDINETNLHTDSKVLIVDAIGILSKIYRYSTICYVGGGFNKSGIHNIIEAAVYGKVVCFGKYFGFSREAASLIKLGAGYSYADASSFSNAVQALLSNKQELENKNEIAKNFVALNKGATNTIMNYIERNLLLSNSIN
jgi:3-deoxy-D-manno-octulosonic-acid transferase